VDHGGDGGPIEGRPHLDEVAERQNTLQQGQPPGAAAMALQSQRGRSQGRGALRGEAPRSKRRGTREALTLRPSGDYLAQTSVFWMESLLERRHYIRSVRTPPTANLVGALPNN
jgi:hypothetical protein